MKKRLIAALLSLVMLLGAVSPVLALGYGEEWQGYREETRQQYSDVAPTHWAFQSIDTCSQRTWFNGYPDGSFRPSALITREEAAKVFAVAMSLQLETDPTPSFVDTANCWAKAYIEATKSLFPNVANLQGTSSFRPTQTITREETIYALVIALGFRSKAVNADLSILNMFSDTSSISAAVKPYVAVAVSEGLVSGMPDGTINCQKGLSRAEFATLLARAINHGLGNTADEFQAPVITLDRYPVATTEETVTITGKVFPTSDVKLSLDGSPVPLSYGAFQLELKLEKAQNQFTLVAENFYGAKDQKDISIDLLKPEISLDDYDTSTTEEKMTVSGRLSPVSAKLYLDSVPVSVNSRSGSFQLPLELKARKNTFTVTAENAAGMISKTSIVIERALPEISIRILTSIPDETSDNTLSLSGRIENYSDDCVLLCGTSRVQVDATGYFELTLDLVPGQNTFTLTAENAAGMISTVPITVNRVMPDVSICILSPIPDDTSANTLSVLGVVENYTAKYLLLCNGNRVQVDAGGYFELTLDLTPGQNTFTLSVLYGKESAAEDTIQVLRLVADGAGEWLEKLPDGVTSEYYNIEKKTQYRSKTRTTQVSSASSIDGWTLIKQGGTWGSWSGWQDSAVSASSTRKVETRQIEATPARTEYRYGRWVNGEPYDHYCKYCLQNGRGRSDIRLDYTSWSTKRLTGIGQSYYCADTSHNSSHIGWTTIYKNVYHCWQLSYKPDPNSRADYYWEESRTIAATYKTQYRYQDYIVQNTFERWSNWSDWMDGTLTANSDTQVETRTVYRFTAK